MLRLLLVAVIGLCVSAVTFPVQKGDVQPSENKYYWPSARGQSGHYGESPYQAPWNLSESLAWSWHHPDGRFHTVLFGSAIDNEKNIYLTAAEGVRKFNPEGQMLWAYQRGKPGYSLTGEITCSASLLDGRLYSYTTDCYVFAISMATGEELWKTKVSDVCGMDTGYTMAQDGIVIAASDAILDNFKTRVRGLDAVHGNLLWTFAPDAPTWTFMPAFPNDGTFVFQDCEGRAYRCNINTGTLLWKAGGMKDTWTDGQALVGSNGVVYAVTRFAPLTLWQPDIPGSVCAYNLNDGRELWNSTTPFPPDDGSVLGRLPGHSGLSLVQPIGTQCLQGAPTAIHAFDANNGDLQWIFNGPKQMLPDVRADAEGMQERIKAGVRAVTKPHPWSAPTIDARGTVYVGNEEGYFYALRDLNLDGRVEGESEVSSYDARAAFHGNSAPAIAPGMLVISSTDTMFVFKE